MSSIHSGQTGGKFEIQETQLSEIVKAIYNHDLKQESA